MTEDQEKIVKKWVTALRSGEYRQTQECLRMHIRDVEDYAHDSYCCLGVLCDLAAEEGIGNWIIRIGRAPFDGSVKPSVDVLTPEVVRWSGLRDSAGRFLFDSLSAALRETIDALYVKRFGGYITLASINDAGGSFSLLADIIESRPAELFMGDD